MKQTISELTIKDIIAIKRKFETENTIFDMNDLKNVAEGTRKAFDKLLIDIFEYEKEEFIEKYTKISQETRGKIEKIKQSSYVDTMDDEEIERLSGYNNAIVWTLSLINPESEFR